MRCGALCKKALACGQEEKGREQSLEGLLRGGCVTTRLVDDEADMQARSMDGKSLVTLICRRWDEPFI